MRERESRREGGAKRERQEERALTSDRIVAGICEVN